LAHITLDGAGLRKVAAEIRSRTARPFALNLWIPLGDSDDPQLDDEAWRAECELLRPWFEELRIPMPARPARFAPRFEEQVETLLEIRPPVFSFVFGVPSSDVLERCRSAGIATLGTATTPVEAKLLADAGVDMVVATGFEAGGHRVSFLREPEDCLTGTLALVPQVADTIKLPIIAAGGMRRRPRHCRGAHAGCECCPGRHGLPGLRRVQCAPPASREAVQRRGKAHDADTCLHRPPGAQHPQWLHRRHARETAGLSTVSRAQLADFAPARGRRWRPGART
jgi:hypothetical protein